MAINAGKRVDLDGPTTQQRAAEEPPLRKGLARCPKCYAVIRPAARKTPHEETAQCKAAQVNIAYEARGWAQLFNVTISRVVEESGAPFEWALGGTHAEVEPDKFNATGQIVEPARTKIVQHLVGFAPKAVVRAAAYITKIRMPPHFRRRAIFALWDQPDLLEAIDAMRRMTENSPTVTVHEAVVMAEERKGIKAHGLASFDDEGEQADLQDGEEDESA